jgi:hypothetical protein
MSANEQDEVFIVWMVRAMAMHFAMESVFFNFNSPVFWPEAADVEQVEFLIW